VRGTLPIPRQVFSPEEGDRKLQDDYLDRTAPLKKDAAPAKDGSVEAWKRAMAAARRENLSSGLKHLWARKAARDRADLRRRDAKAEAFRVASATPEREDDRLTRPTVLSSALRTEVIPDPDRFEKAEERRRHTELKAQEKREARRDALMELYLNAANFIVDEASLEKEVNHVFSNEYWRETYGFSGETPNVWEVASAGQPDLETMLGSLRNNGQRPFPWQATYSRNVKRQKKTAEELTGGKLA
jgi:hypothetical protein